MPRVGILGGGQLGLMMILEGRKLGIEFSVYDENPEAPALRLTNKAYTGEDWVKLVEESDVVTFEFEHVKPSAVRAASSFNKLAPSELSIIIKQDKIREKTFLKDHDLPTPRFIIAHSHDDVYNALERFGRVVVKMPWGAYDGKGQYYLGNKGDLMKIPNKYPLLVEEWVDIEREVSVILVKSDRETKVYPLTENYHYNGILLYSIAPACVKEDIRKTTIDIAMRLANILNYMGVLAIEFFITRDGKVLINEFAPRVHNSGHWTLLGAVTSQFENHVRAILGLPLGSTDLVNPTAMINILGVPYNQQLINNILSIDKTQVWWYGKTKVTPRRKMGHVNIMANNRDELLKKMGIIMNLIYGDKLDQYVPPWYVVTA